MSDPRVTVELLARTNLAVKATLSQAWGKQWQEVLNDTGMGKCTLANDDPDLALVEYGDFLRFSLDGVACFMSIVEQIDRVDVAPGEEADEYTTLSGRGTLACLEDAVVWPSLYVETLPFSDARIWNYSEFGVISTPVGGGFLAASGMYDFGAQPAAGPVYSGMPTDFPDNTCHWLGPQAPNGSGDDPVGDWYYVQILVLPTDDRYRLYLGFDDGIEVYMDGVPVLKADSSTFDTSRVIDLQLAGVLHYMAFKITNTVNASPNPTGFIAELVNIKADGTIGSAHYKSLTTNANAYYMKYPPSEPGLTVGMITRLLLEEAQTHPADNRDSFPLLTWTFTDTLDSAGVAWADTIQPSFQIGTDYLTMLKQLCETYCVPHMAPDTLELSLYQNYGAASGATYAKAVNITDLRHTGKT